MTVVSWEDLTSGRLRKSGPVNLSIGVFDGIHIGHRALLAVVTEGPALPMVVTFRESPASVLMKGAFPGTILSPGQKMERLEELGVQVTVVIDFSDRLSKLSGKAFIGLLRDNLAVAKIVVGYNFRLGKERDTGARDLERLFGNGETRVEEIGPVHYRRETVSSSRIRGLIREGVFSDAFDMLTKRYSLDVRDIAAEPSIRGGSSRLRIKRKDIRQCLPKPGNYSVSCRTGGGGVPGSLTVLEDEVDIEWAGRERLEEAEFRNQRT